MCACILQKYVSWWCGCGVVEAEPLHDLPPFPEVGCTDKPLLNVVLCQAVLDVAGEGPGASAYRKSTAVTEICSWWDLGDYGVLALLVALVSSSRRLSGLPRNVKVLSSGLVRV